MVKKDNMYLLTNFKDILKELKLLRDVRIL